MSIDSKAVMKKIIINNGVALGIISILFSVISYVMGNQFQPHWSVQLIGFLTFIYFILSGVNAFKKEKGGFLKLGEALKIGLGIALISAIIGVIYFVIFTQFIETNYFVEYTDWQRDTVLESRPNATDAEIKQIDVGMEMQKPFMNTGVFSAVQLMMGLFLGFIVSLIGGLFMKKDDPYEHVQQD
tara:strand:+ start:279 stop:833 length:555 start_codon:yes stop_codon:yes gene_type:complete